MNRERRVGRRSVVQNRVKLTPECKDEEKLSKGPKKSLFSDDTSFVMRRTLKPLHENNNFQFSSSKSKSHEKLNEDTYTYTQMLSKQNKMPLSPPSRSRFFESSMIKKCKEPIEPVLQSKELFNSLIDSPCTKFEKVQFNNALSSASKYLLNRHLDSVKSNVDIFKETSPDLNLTVVNKKNLNDCNNPCSKYDSSLNQKTLSSKTYSDSQTQTSKMRLKVDNIEENKKNQIEDIHQAKLKLCESVRACFNEIELHIEKQFGIIENKITEKYENQLRNICNENNDSDESQTLDTTVETVKEKNYTRMTGAFGILNNLNQDCSFLKTPQTTRITRKDILTPHTMSFVIQEQLMNLNSSS